MSVASRPGRASPIKILARGETRELAPGKHTDFSLARAETTAAATGS
jgi:hypothetical protein